MIEINNSLINEPVFKYLKNSIIKVSKHDNKEKFRVKTIQYINDSADNNEDKFFYDHLEYTRFLNPFEDPSIKDKVAFTKEDAIIRLNSPGVIGENIRHWEFIYCHECLHLLWETFEVEKKIINERGDCDHMLLNIVSDCVINDYLSFVRQKLAPNDLITPEYIKKQFGVTYDRVNDTQYTLYMKCLPVSEKMKKDQLIKQNMQQGEPGDSNQSGQSSQSNQSGQSSQSNQSGQSGQSSQSNQSGQSSKSNQGGQSGQNDKSNNSDIDKMTANEAAKAAQKAADEAKEAAKEAQKVADEAKGTGDKQKASNSQKAADEAKEAAKAAQKAADEAKEAASNGNKEKAQKAAKEARNQADKAKEKANEAKGKESNGNKKSDSNDSNSEDGGKNNQSNGGNDKGGNDAGSQSTDDIDKEEAANYEKIKEAAKANIRKYQNRISGDLGDFLKKCRSSFKLEPKGLATETNSKTNSAWNIDLNNTINSYVKVKVNRHKRLYKKSYSKVKRGSGFVQIGQPLMPGKVQRKNTLVINAAFYIDRSGSMSRDNRIDHVFDACYTICESLKRMFGRNAVVDSTEFNIYAFNTSMVEIKFGNKIGPSGGTMPFDEILEYISKETNDYMINIVITDGEMNVTKTEVIKFANEVKGMVVFVSLKDEEIIRTLSEQELRGKLYFIEASNNFRLDKD